VRDLVHRLLDRVGDFVQGEILRRDHPATQQVFLHVTVPGLPVGAARLVEQHQLHRLALAGLQ
jgi:hypothetical protein